jgi:Cu+-exporting ATPase
MLRRRLLVAAGPTLVIVVLAMVPPLQFTGWQWAVAVLSVPVVTWGAWPFHRAAFQAGVHGSTTMDTLVSLGVIASTLWSWWALLFGGAGMLGMRMQMSLVPRTAAGGGHAEIYFEGACVIVVFLLIGRLAEARTRYRAGDALRSLLELGAKEATRLRIDEDGSRSEERIPVADLQVGDLFLVRPGEKVATDGRVEDGSSALDASMLTGESVPADVSPGDEVTGATVNTWGSLVVRATRVGGETTLAQIGRLVTEAQAGKAPVQRLADRISSVFVPVIMAISAATLIGWLASGAGAQAAITAAVAVLVVACPCALGLATPTALLVGSGRASQLGIVIKSAEILEQTRAIDTMVLDKTGTVTTGRMSLERVVTAAGDEDAQDRLLAVAAGVESPSEHPMARAIVAGVRASGVEAAPVAAFTNHAGTGVSALVRSGRGQGGALAMVGRLSWLRGLGVEVPGELADAAREAEDSGASAVLLATVPGWADGPEAGTGAEAARIAPGTGRHPAEDAPSGEIPAGDPALVHVDMDVQGMTCASCVNRVERKLGKLPGVSASVNLATESATITLDRPYTDAQLEEVVDNAGYHGIVRSRSEARPGIPTETAAAPSSGKALLGAASGPATDSAPRRERVLPGHLAGATAHAVLVVRDTVKPTSATAIGQLRELGIEPVLLTGDNQAAAEHVAGQIGIERVIAQVMPDQKRDVVRTLQDQGRVVAMVGDGVNDAAALAQAGNRGLGIAMGSGTDVAIQVADITLVNSELTAAATAIRVSRQTLRVIKQNLFWAFFYNVAMVPLAIAGLLNPMIAAAAMAFSSVFVVLNSLRLRRAG